MSLFSYKARDANGQLKQGTIEAENPAGVADSLVQRSLTPLNIEQIDQQDSKSDSALDALQQKLNRPGRPELILFSRQMYSLTKAGVPLITGMRRLGESTSNDRFKEIIEDIVDQLESGRELASAMASHEEVFGSLYINMIRIGEQSGRVDESFYRMYEFLEKDEATLRNIKSAVRYPTFVIIAIVIAVAIIMTFVIPQFASIYSSFKLELPLPTRIIIATSNFFRDYWFIVFGGAAAAAYAFRRYINTSEGRLWWDQKKNEVSHHR